jgi:hypothetical protein
MPNFAPKAHFFGGVSASKKYKDTDIHQLDK